MAEQDTHRHTGDVREGETQPTNTDHVSASGELKQEETDSALNVKSTEDSASSSASTDTETKTNDGEDMEQAEIKNGDSAEENPLAEGSSPSEASTLTLEDKCTPPQADDGSHGDHNKPTPRNEQPTVIEEISSEYHTEEKREPKTSTPSPLDDRQGDQVGEPIGRLNEESTGTNNTDSEAEKDDVRGLYKQEYTTPPKTVLNQEISNEEKMDEQTENVETIHPTAKETIVSTNPVAAGGSRYLIAVGIVAVVALLVQQLLQLESPPQEKDVRQIDIFLSQMEKLKTQFPNQRAELWKRSRVHLLRHLQTTQPTEPVSLILTAGVKAEKTLHCLAQALASAFSSPLNASVLHIDGASKASQDSDQVKLEIDSKLQGAFEGDKPVAVIHRFEELPPGSTLIFYRYCDHENAAYKKTCLIFTVLLGEEEEIPAKSGLSTVEEMVDDHLQKKFLSDSHPVSFDRMDLDKYGGLWSRISHLILPVTAEEGIEQEGC